MPDQSHAERGDFAQHYKQLLGSCFRPDLRPCRGGPDLLEDGLTFRRSAVVRSIARDDQDAAGPQDCCLSFIVFWSNAHADGA